MPLVKHPAVVGYEKREGCKAVTRMGFDFELVDTDKLKKDHHGNVIFPRLESSDIGEKSIGAPMHIFRGPILKTGK